MNKSVQLRAADTSGNIKDMFMLWATEKSEFDS